MKSPEQRLSEINMRTASGSLSMGLKGEYQITVRRNGFVIHQTPWFDNLILNQGLDYMATNGSLFRYCQLGTGTSVPTPTQTHLDAVLAVNSTVGFNSLNNSPGPNYKSNLITNYAFTQGSVIGTVTEVGIGPTTGGNLTSRALITDSGGAPTPLTLTALDQVTVSYGFTWIPDTTMGNGSVVLDGVTYNYTSQVTDMNSYGMQNSQPISALYGGDSFHPFMGLNSNGGIYIGKAGQTLPADPVAALPTYQLFYPTSSDGPSYAPSTYLYTPGSYTALASFKLTSGIGNVAGGIQFIVVKTSAWNQFGGVKVLWYFPTPIPKTNIHELTLTMTTTWGNAP
jgi:hypothetical protein